MSTQTTPVSAAPHIYERRNRSDEVMAAAISLISERGYSATTLRDVADRVGLLKGSLYHYFSSKEDLLYRILSNSQARSFATSEEVAAMGLEPGAELFEYIRRACTYYFENTEVARIYFSEARHLTGERRESIAKFDVEFEGRLRERVRRAQEAGQITPEQPVLLITAYILGSLITVRRWPRSLAGVTTEAEAIDGFVSLMRKSLAT